MGENTDLVCEILSKIWCLPFCLASSILTGTLCNGSLPKLKLQKYLKHSLGSLHFEIGMLQEQNEVAEIPEVKFAYPNFVWEPVQTVYE